MIVSKFGGTSVGTFEATQRSARIVAADENRRLIVISATSGTTNDLVALSAANVDSTMREELLGRIEKRHIEIIEQCKEQDKLRDAFYSEFSALREHLDFVGRDKRWKDRLYSFGELMSTRIFVEILIENGVDAEWVDARQMMKTDSTFWKCGACFRFHQKEN